MSLSNIFRGIGGEIEIGRSLLASDMSPASAAFDFRYRGLRHSVVRGDGTLRSGCSTYLDNHSGSQLTRVGALASAIGPMCQLVLRVLGLRSPSQIAKAVVRSAPISMCGFMNRGRRITEKGDGDNPMEIVVLGAARDRQADAMVVSQSTAYPWLQDVADRKTGLLTRGRQYPFHASFSARRIVRRERYRLPNLGAMLGISHGAVPRIIGQGRALLTQRFRPAFYGRFPVRSQAEAAA